MRQNYNDGNQKKRYTVKVNKQAYDYIFQRMRWIAVGEQGNATFTYYESENEAYMANNVFFEQDSVTYGEVNEFIYEWNYARRNNRLRLLEVVLTFMDALENPDVKRARLESIEDSNALHTPLNMEQHFTNFYL